MAGGRVGCDGRGWQRPALGGNSPGWRAGKAELAAFQGAGWRPDFAGRSLPGNGGEKMGAGGRADRSLGTGGGSEQPCAVGWLEFRRTDGNFATCENEGLPAAGPFSGLPAGLPASLPPGGSRSAPGGEAKPLVTSNNW